MSRVLPILFNTDMVQAILDGRKTVTRRIMKSQPTGRVMHLTGYKTDEWGEEKETETGGKYFSRFKLPYHQGDILYVRETWTHGVRKEKYLYKENWERTGMACLTKWRPSIHMPKEAARIFLKVTNVRLERLQDMTLDHFLSEGVCILPEAFNDPDNAYEQAKKIFTEIWNSTLKKSDLVRYGWEANPWVWVIEFERIEPDKGQL